MHRPNPKHRFVISLDTMSFTVLSATPTEPIGLCSTPNVTESEHISESLRAHQVPAITDLMNAGCIRILNNYRGWNLYCEGGVTVYRKNPKSEGGHGFAGQPIPGSEEEADISCDAGVFKCTIKYDQPRFTPDSIMGMLWKACYEKVKDLTHAQIQAEYVSFCRKARLAPCWEPYGAYPIPV